jgi:hypothetical protein
MEVRSYAITFSPLNINTVHDLALNPFIRCLFCHVIMTPARGTNILFVEETLTETCTDTLSDGSSDVLR